MARVVTQTIVSDTTVRAPEVPAAVKKKVETGQSQIIYLVNLRL